MADAAVTVTVTHGTAKHNIEVRGQDGVEPLLKDMADVIMQVTGVPLQSQKLICKGKSLREMEQSLSSLGIKQGCKVMLIGKRNSPEEEAGLKKLKELEKSMEQILKKLEKVDGELSGLKNGFLAKDLQAEALGKLDHRVKGTAEQFMKLLEQLDSMSLPENFSDCRIKKKGLVKTIQTHLALCDRIEASISDQQTKLHSKNFALSE